jgi:hypothetical protein
MSQFGTFLQMLKDMGVQHQAIYQMPKERWQKIVFDAGFYMTSLGCCAISVHSQVYVFAMGVYLKQHGEKIIQSEDTGLFMFMYDEETGNIFPTENFVNMVECKQ